MMNKTIEIAKPQSLFFKALANRGRMSIINLLETGARNVNQIADDLELDQTLVSHHLRCLSFCGFVASERNGKSRTYSLNKETISPLLQLVDKHLGKFATNLYECETLER